MSDFQLVTLSGTCDASGDLTLTADKNTWGYIDKVVMDYDNGDTGADIVITNEDGAATTAVMTKANLGTADATFQPRSLANKVADGSAFTDVAVPIFVTGNMKMVISNGGNAKKFKFITVIVR